MEQKEIVTPVIHDEVAIFMLVCEEVSKRGKVAEIEVDGKVSKIRIYVIKGNEKRPISVIPLDFRLLEVGNDDLDSAVKAAVTQALGAAVAEPAIKEPAHV